MLGCACRRPYRANLESRQRTKCAPSKDDRSGSFRITFAEMTIDPGGRRKRSCHSCESDMASTISKVSGAVFVRQSWRRHKSSTRSIAPFQAASGNNSPRVWNYLHGRQDQESLNCEHTGLCTRGCKEPFAFWLRQSDLPHVGEHIGGVTFAGINDQSFLLGPGHLPSKIAKGQQSVLVGTREFAFHRQEARTL